MWAVKTLFIAKVNVAMRSLYDQEIQKVTDYVKYNQSEVEALHPGLQSYCGY